jgi:hypothetical protein
MCLLSYHGPGVVACEEHLRNGMEVNPEGAGWAVTDGEGFMLSNKGLDSEFMLEQYLVLRRRWPDLHGAFHSRLSTGTRLTADNCHPFPVGGSNHHAMLFHNGSLYPVPSTEPRCDSRIFADDGLMIRGELDVPASFRAAEDYIDSTGGKVLVLTDGIGYREPAYIFCRDQWILSPDGALHSNADFLGKGDGWDEITAKGELYRFNLLQPGQCPDCHRYGCPSLEAPGAGCQRKLKVLPPRYRNETDRRRRVEAHTRNGGKES